MADHDPAQGTPKLSDPHPHWSVENKNENYPKSVEEWDPRKDPVGQHLALAEKRLRVAMDRDDPRAPDEMALISRWDLTTLVHDWWHKCAVFDLWLAERKAKEASPTPSTDGAIPKSALAVTPEEIAAVRDLIASHLDCEADCCQKQPAGCGCALNAARAVLALPRPVRATTENTGE